MNLHTKSLARGSLEQQPQTCLGHDWYPRINWLTLPPEEMANARYVQSHLAALVALEAQFSSARSLLEHSSRLDAELKVQGIFGKEREAVANWKKIAGSHAVLSIYHFGATIDLISKRVRNCPILRSSVDTDRLDAAVFEFEFQFPNSQELRDAMTHHADQPGESADGSDYVSGFLHCHFNERTLNLTTNQGNAVDQPVTTVELAKLAKLRRGVNEAFRKVSLL